jgi:curved DNA-binding protein CbpA
MGTENKINEDAVPLVCESSDLTGTDLTPEEGFILSRLDGLTNVKTVCGISGLGREKTMDMIQSLYDKGMITFHGEEPSCSADETDDGLEDEEIIDSGAELETEAQADREGGEQAKTEDVGAGVGEGGPGDDLSPLKSRLRGKLPKGDDLLSVVEEIFVNLEHLSYYDVLGLGMKADQKQVKKAYLRATKSFHPDRFYRRADPETKRKLQEIFKQVNKGYKLLSDEEARKEYDDSLGEVDDEFYDEEVEAAPTASRTRTVKGEASPFRRIKVARQKPIEEKVRAPKKKAEKPKPKGPRLKVGMKGGRRPRSKLMEKIQKIKAEEGTENIDQAERLYEGAMVEREKGNMNAAKINLQLAIQYAPGVRRYKEALEGLDKMESSIKAIKEFKAGIQARADGYVKDAMRHFKTAMRLGYDNSRLYNNLAELLMELDNNYDGARTMVLKAIEMEEGVADYHMTLARAYRGMDKKAAAKVQFEKVLEIEPKNKQATKELKALKRG